MVTASLEGDDPQEVRLVEFVVGTMPADERAAFAAEAAADAALAQRVQAWEEALAPLFDAVPPVAPSNGLWLRVAASLGAVGAGGSRFASAGLERLEHSRRGWRLAAIASGAVAAGLALFVASEKLISRVPPSGLVAVVNRSGELPALLVRVDQAAGTVQVRSLAAETPPNRSLELWSIVGSEKPRSLGVIAPGATRVSIPASDKDRLDGATLAVTVEPAGGTGDRGPTGPVVYSGKLVPERE